MGGSPTKVRRLIDVALRWDEGYITVAVYIQGKKNIRLQQREMLERDLFENKYIFRRTTLILVTDSREDDLDPNRFYPNNILRNVAVEYAPTKRILLLDVDFIPSVGAYSKLMAYYSVVTTTAAAFTSITR